MSANLLRPGRGSGPGGQKICWNLFCTAQSCGVVWCGMVVCGVVWHVVWYGGMVVWHVVWYGVVWCGMVWCDKSNPILKQSAVFQDRKVTWFVSFVIFE